MLHMGHSPHNMGHPLHKMGDALPSMGRLHIKAMPQLDILLALLVPTLLQATHQQVILVYLLRMPQGLMAHGAGHGSMGAMLAGGAALPLLHVGAHHLCRGSYGHYAHDARMPDGKFKHGRFGGLAWRFQEVEMRNVNT